MDRGRGEALTVRVALERLKAAQKPSAGTPLYSRIVNRPVGRVFAAVAATSGLGPNAVSLISSAFSLTGIALVAFGSPSVALGLLVALLLVVGYALDSADGQVARLTGKGSVTGEWLDHMLDAVKIACLHAAVAWSALHHAQTTTPVAIALGFGIVAFVTFFGMILTDQLRRAAGVPKAEAASTGSDLLRALVVLPSDYGVLCLAFLLFGLPTAFYTVYGLLGAGTAVLLVVAVARWHAQLHHVDDARRSS
ncbi:CDP-alcohol phosphatidyltransferase family protein [Oryzobacter terrae]|uniref:CDP-alcohol phosphatidyltransferase family protein n=1 Tax=Oryzobacter terrae TaxID=1620385 RepID=UPI003671A316